MGRLEALTPETRTEALTYLARRPYENVYVAWLIATERYARASVWLWRDASGAVAGACYFGAQIVPCGESEGIEAFAERSRTVRGTRMLVGARPAVERFWRRARSWLPQPYAVRAVQPLYALEPPALRAFAPDPLGEAARATADEVDELVPHAARMLAGEVGGDPSRLSGEFRTRCAGIVAAGWWWRYRVAGRLAFTCNIGSATAQTAQVQGVWTPPELRGGGHATRGLAAICDGMLATVPTLCLYVNDFNAPAIALYERVGFVRVGEYSTILLA
ncbi:MAG: GNAT family N-acetyltransferase [Vulcanimicrobiaceae bacterium]